MNASESTEASFTRLILPWDLTHWFSGQRLLQWVEEEVGTLNWTNPSLLEHLALHPDFRPRVLLTVMTWCYGTGIFESGEITRTCDADSSLRQLCEGQPPSEKVLARFRRENRGLLKWALVQFFRRALQERFDLGDWFPPGLKRFLAEAATLRLDLARQIDRGSSGF